MTTAGQFCKRRVVIAKKGESLLEAAARMRDEHVGSLVVVEDLMGLRVPVGILTDRDIVVGILARTDRHLSGITVEEAMSPEPMTARADEELGVTLKRMRAHGVRRMPILNATGALEGLVTFDDLLEHITEQLEDMVKLLPREREQEKTRTEEENVYRSP